MSKRHLRYALATGDHLHLSQIYETHRQAVEAARIVVMETLIQRRVVSIEIREIEEGTEA